MPDRALPAQMKALRFNAYGPPSKLQLVDVVRQAARFGDVLVQVQAAGVNPSDVKNVAGKFPQTTTPRTPGRDFAGIVVDGPAHLEGTEVWGTGGDLGFTRDGSHAEYIRVPLDGIRPRPRELTVEQAAAVGVPFATAWMMLDRAQVRAGDTVLVIGGTGAVGSAAVQLARWMGARVIATTRRTDPPGEFLANVDKPIRLDREPLLESTLAFTGGRGADVVINTAGGETFSVGVEAAARGGRVLAISSNPPQVSFDLVQFYRKELSLLGVDSLKVEAAQMGPILDRLNAGFARGALRVPQPTSVALSDAAQAYQRVAEGGHEKFVLIPGR